MQNIGKYINVKSVLAILIFFGLGYGLSEVLHSQNVADVSVVDLGLQTASVAQITLDNPATTTLYQADGPLGQFIGQIVYETETSVCVNTYIPTGTFNLDSGEAVSLATLIAEGDVRYGNTFFAHAPNTNYIPFEQSYFSSLKPTVLGEVVLKIEDLTGCSDWIEAESQQHLTADGFVSSR